MDIGSRDGLNSVVFRKILPQAEIVAFEASPDNFHELENSKLISASNIKLVNKAVTDKNGQLTFNIVEPTEENEQNKGTSSIRQKKNETARQVTVDAITVDSFLMKLIVIISHYGLTSKDLVMKFCLVPREFLTMCLLYMQRLKRKNFGMVKN